MCVQSPLPLRKDESMPKSLSKNLGELLTRYSTILIQKWEGNRACPYTLSLGTWNKLGEGKTLEVAAVNALKKRREDIEGENFND